MRSFEDGPGMYRFLESAQVRIEISSVVTKSYYGMRLCQAQANFLIPSEIGIDAFKEMLLIHCPAIIRQYGDTTEYYSTPYVVEFYGVDGNRFA